MASNIPNFTAYVASFYSVGGLYDMGATMKQINAATLKLINSGADFAADSFDRERVRDIMIEDYKLTFPH